MEQIKWQRGNFLKFFAQMKIRVGGASPVDIMKGDEFEYDGSILKYSGMEFSQPQMRGAVLSGWATLAMDDMPSVEAVRPTRNIAKAQTINRDLNKVQRASPAVIETSSLDEDEVLQVADRSSASPQGPKIITAQDNRKSRLDVKSDTSDDQGAVTIARIKTSAKATFEASRSDSGRKLQELENLSNVRADLIEKTVVKEGVTIKSNVGRVDRIETDSSDESNVVGRVRNSSVDHVEGISIRDTSNIRDPKPAKAISTEKLSPRIRIARSICPDFPSDWVFEGKLADRLAALKSVNPSAEFIEALYAAEGDQMRKLLVKEYPEQFDA
jgi:hypothetical protein